MSVQQPVLTPPHGGETVTSRGGSSVEMKVESSQSGGEYGTVMWTLRAGEEPPLHIHSREDELLYVVQGELIARVGDARIEVGPAPTRLFPAVCRIRSRWSAIRRPCCSATCRVDWSASGSDGKAAARPGRFRADVPLGAASAAFVTVRVRARAPAARDRAR